MTIITQYQCDLCGTKYLDEESARDCEAEGEFDNSLYPAGLMYPYSHHGFVGIFAIPAPIPNTQGGKDKHMGVSSSWACRVSKNDSLGDERCGGNYYYSTPSAFKNWIEYHHMSPENLKCKEFKCMVDYLKSVNIQPSYYDETGKLHLV